MFSSSIFLNNIYNEFHGHYEDCMEKTMFPISHKKVLNFVVGKVGI